MFGLRMHVTTNSIHPNLEENDDSDVVKLDMNKVAENVKLLQKSLVVKVFGKGIPLSLYSIELRHRWDKFGKFHITSLGLECILCSFHSPQIMEEVLSGGPWYVGGHITGMDK
ncbi:hypothetical protein MA16_Dca003851 [Dendrobium catenatum]|uniref:DUF4283 domain-containing protein n=1 Tax=Dendrobium catenatum TaxID=906689 RepID=A0A2I0X1P0_9ASPA|nr:hypothetical protein MA16_Dca003851 [Dendrobium catenatum]